jgi:NAD(P)H dehydrogenase (quinone)
MYMQNLFGYGGARFIQGGVIRQYIGDARLSWVDCDDVAAVAAASLLDPAKHHAKTYRMGYEAKSYNEIAALMTSIIGQPFRYEPRPPQEWFDAILAAGAEPAYMKCVYECYRDFGLGKLIGDEVFDNLPSIIGRKPKTLTGLIQDNADKFLY